uniref:WD_REPEATS_REGION domain-containing protein n=1 Tax=Steinernema glaseri TaxID=37863 RepID=A0A1I7ZTI3_9BILA
MEEEEAQHGQMIYIKFVSEEGDSLSEAPIYLDTTTTVAQLQLLCNQLLGSDDDPVPISFRTSDGVDIAESIFNTIPSDKIDIEKALELIYLPQAVFRVRPVTRCSSSLPGHGEPVISTQFSPNGRGLASGSGDMTVRFWDTNLELPYFTSKGHTNWVLCISWSPNNKKLASACKDGAICIWNPVDGKQMGKALKAHKQWITALAWNPLHKDPASRYLASAGKDTCIRIWDTVQMKVERVLGGHTAGVTCLRWGGEGLLYSGSQDRTIKVWRVEDGVMCRSLAGHAHWINTLALNVDYVLRTSCFEPEKECAIPKSEQEGQQIAQIRYDKARKNTPERLVSGSDDFTMFLWTPSESKQPIARMTGHQQLVNQVMFSPDTRYIASASFDKSIKLWDGRTGKYITSLRGHVNAVYQISWSADSRLLVSGSADSTLKLWDMKTKKLMFDLPGHGDEVFAVDWSPDGSKVVSGGRDKVLKIWKQ